ncbi:DEAD/DEAH box helicase [Paraliobacillus sediminis]|uniref:DEAD/DEAH box helicase n=1 Tax=Paraliobacillus sediminis TaxID=1885916 RepID=UPI000E3D5044|nr:DEAD/DEAH box helicase [Paraliobacillus sediminis]
MFNNTMKDFLEKAWENAGFDAPTQVQEQAVPLIIEGKDVIVESPTGSGKTLAYLLPILQEIDINQKQVQVVILASSHELVMQIYHEVQNWTKDSDISGIALIGGANIKRQIEKLKKKPQLIVGTPGRVLELIKQKKLKVHQVKTIILDEADQLLVPEHKANLFTIIKSTPSERQMLLFSATLPEALALEAQSFMVAPETIRVNREDAGTPDVTYSYLLCEAREKIDVLRKIVRNENIQALVFFRDIGNLSVMAEKLNYKGMRIGELHGDLNKQEREKAIREFGKNELELLLATDVAARGLDIKDLSHVIQMDVPADSKQYIHRSGRTGRLGASGEGNVLSIITTAEERMLKSISRELDIELVEKVLQKGMLVNKR